MKKKKSKGPHKSSGAINELESWMRWKGSVAHIVISTNGCGGFEVRMGDPAVQWRGSGPTIKDAIEMAINATAGDRALDELRRRLRVGQ